MLRTFSKVYGLSGLRAGYVVGSPQAGGLLDALAPALGVNALSQAAAEQALKIGDGEVDGRSWLDGRTRLLNALASMPVDAPPSQANFVWLRAAPLSGAELAARLEEPRCGWRRAVRSATTITCARRSGAARRPSGCSRRLAEAIETEELALAAARALPGAPRGLGLA